MVEWMRRRPRKAKRGFIPRVSSILFYAKLRFAGVERSETERERVRRQPRKAKRGFIPRVSSISFFASGRLHKTRKNRLQASGFSWNTLKKYLAIL
ncbi:MAG: hypothetical protein IKY46_08160 [Clostridia bacterium]|nr:hypothetical protein [Clostridia bacterium]